MPAYTCADDALYVASETLVVRRSIELACAVFLLCKNRHMRRAGCVDLNMQDLCASSSLCLYVPACCARIACSLHRATRARQLHPAAGCILVGPEPPAVLCCSRSSGSFGLCATVCRALADMKDKLRQTLGSAIITNSAGCLEEHFV